MCAQLLLSLGWLLPFAHHEESDDPDALAAPRTWDESMLHSMELPLAHPEFTPVHVSAEHYEQIPVGPILRTYPVYAPGSEPEGYLDSLRTQTSTPNFDVESFQTEADWIEAGRHVFRNPVFFDGFLDVDMVRDPDWHAFVQPPVAADGTIPALQYVVRESGRIQVGSQSCAMCHTRVLPDGRIVDGAQGNFSVDRAVAYKLRSQDTTDPRNAAFTTFVRGLQASRYGAPWVASQHPDRLLSGNLADFAAQHAAIPAGVASRVGTTLAAPAQIPDLIGVKDRVFLDHSGVQVHRSIGDMMRYVAINQGMNQYASYGGFVPASVRVGPNPAGEHRYSDDQLLALSLYLYSLKAPENPNAFDERAARGEQIFRRESCHTCHPAPLYTNNKLIPVDGFQIPDGHRDRYDILNRPIGTDPTLALETRRGTGYYRVPSLRGVWYRGPFEHNGSVATLQDWFDPARLEDDYVPTGFRGHQVSARAIPGHRFGLELTDEDRGDLIAFLKTL